MTTRLPEKSKKKKKLKVHVSAIDLNHKKSSTYNQSTENEIVTQSIMT